MKCITCGENEAINDFYKECVGCIEEYEKNKKMVDKNKLCSVWYCENKGVHYHQRGGCGIMFCEEHETQDKNPNPLIVELGDD